MSFVCTKFRQDAKMIKWLIKRNGAGTKQCIKFGELKCAVAEEVGNKTYNDIFCDNTQKFITEDYFVQQMNITTIHN
jgi:hypothetical protein